MITNPAHRPAASALHLPLAFISDVKAFLLRSSRTHENNGNKKDGGSQGLLMHRSLVRPLPTDLLGYQTQFNDLSLNKLRGTTPETQYIGPIPIPNTRL